MIVNPDTCQHKFVYQGLVYDHDNHQLPGSGAHGRNYYEAYFCEKCLERKYVFLEQRGNSYYAPEFGATPKGISRQRDS